MLNSSHVYRFMKILPTGIRLAYLAKSGDTNAFIKLYDACIERVYQHIYLQVTDEKVAEGIAFQLFLKAWKQLEDYRVLGPSFISWLHSISQKQIIAYSQTHKKNIAPDQVLISASGLNSNKEVIKPSPAFTDYARGALLHYISSHPRQPQTQTAFSWRMSLTFAMLLMALLVTEGTVYAQSALPGETFYLWKRTSEQVWRVVSLDPVGVDIVLAYRRLDEWIAVADNPLLSEIAKNGYLEALASLKSNNNNNNNNNNAESLAVIVPALELQQQTLVNAGLSAPELDSYLTVATVLLATVETAVALPSPTATLTVAPSATDIPTDMPTMTDMPTNIPTVTATLIEIIPTNTQEEIEPTATDVPTETATLEPTATDVPTETATLEPTATDVPTETPMPEPTATETEIPTLEPTPTP